MQSISLFDLYLLATFFVTITALATWLVLWLFLKQSIKMSQEMQAAMFADDASEMVDTIDDRFASSPVGIPPSLGRE